MMAKKLFNFSADFAVTKSECGSTDSGTLEPIFIEGYANTTSKDRAGDVILPEAWTKGALTNYQKNPIVLAYHDHTEPIGTTESLSVDANGLKVRCKISPAAEDVYCLIKDGVLKTFSVGFMIKDAMYDSDADVFAIKDLELLEISVVSVPANQDSTFSLTKSFDSDEELKEFKKSFVKEITSEKKVDETTKSADTDTPSTELNMTKEELDAIVKSAAETAAQAAAVAATAAVAAKAAPAVEVGMSGAEKLLADIEAKMAQNEDNMTKSIEGLRGELAEKTAEIAALTQSKMRFEEKANETVIPYSEKEAAFLLAMATGKDLTKTKLWDGIVQKYGQHVPHADWEYTISTNMQDEIRRQLVVAPLFKQLNMPTPVIKLPVNPEAGYASWVQASAYKTTASSGTEATHTLKEITLSAYKLATKEFLGVEEEDDAVIALLPIVRDAMVRRTAKAVDKALLHGAATGADPLKGLTKYETSSANVTVTTTAKVTAANLATLRRNLGTWGLNPQDVIYVVGSDVYYDLLDDSNFLTRDKAGPNATLFNGDIGMVGGSRVIVSGEFLAKSGGTAGSIGAIALNTNNFMIGNYKGLKVESDYLVEQQYRILVSSLRMAFQQISTVDGQGVSCLRWT